MGEEKPMTTGTSRNAVIAVLATLLISSAVFAASVVASDEGNTVTLGPES